MPIDLSSAFQSAEDFLRRHIKPKAVAAAEKRRRERKTAAALRRLGRAVSVTGVSGVGLVGYGAAVAPVGTAGLAVAAVATAVAAGAALFWPARSPLGRISREELIALVLEAEDWLLRQRQELPGRAIPPLDKIFFRLNDLQPHLPALDPHGPLAWDLRRLLTDHLPRLIQSYGSLPATVRDADLLQRLIDGLETLDEELIRICKEASRDHMLSFQVQERFIETRYRDGEDLRKN